MAVNIQASTWTVLRQLMHPYVHSAARLRHTAQFSGLNIHTLSMFHMAYRTLSYTATPRPNAREAILLHSHAAIHAASSFDLRLCMPGFQVF
jgi:23S rRNA maturation-related 3'-5' exoribonuclease YhaM